VDDPVGNVAEDRRLSRDLALVIVPDRILVAFVAELRLYGFWLVEGTFAELL
jgi:hypothetical protein